MSNRSLSLAVLAVLALQGLAGCSRGRALPDDPKRRLTEYISLSFEVKDLEDRKRLMTFLTGEAFARLNAWSEDQFRGAFIDSKRKFVKLSFVDVKKTSATGVDVTYDLVYLDQTPGHESKITNRKLADMVFAEGKWLIDGVHNIKELVEYRNEMSLP